MPSVLSRLQLRQLRLIRAIHQTGQLSLASAALNVAQPAASRSLAEIEKLVGATLFLRHPKGMEPTPIGRVVAGHAERLLGHFDSAVADIDNFREGLSGRVRLGAVTGAAVGVGVPAVRRLKADVPLAKVELKVAPSAELVQDMTMGELDLALCRLPPEIDRDFLDIAQGREEVVRVLVRRGHPVLRQARPTLGDLAGFTWIMQGNGMPIRDAVDGAFIAAGLGPPADTIDTASLLVAIDYLSDTDAIAVVTVEVMELLAAARSDWQAVELAERIVLPPWVLVRPRDRRDHPLSRRLHDLLLDEIRAPLSRHARS